MEKRGPIVAIGELLWDVLPDGRRAGGAPFNFAFHCHQLGHEAVIVSRVGDDELGRELRAEVRRLGMSDEFIQTDSDRPTGTVDVQVDAAGQPTYSIVHPVAWDFIEWQTKKHDVLCSTARAVCFGTLAQRSPTSHKTISRFLSSTPESCLAFCDINFRRPWLTDAVILESLRLCDWLKANEEEAESIITSTLTVTDFDDRHSRPKWLLKQLMSAIADKHSLCAITRGANGCIVADAKTTVQVDGIPIRVADTVGAGDSFTAALLTQRLEGKSLAQSVRFANAYASVVASKSGGTPIVSREEVERLL